MNDGAKWILKDAVNVLRKTAEKIEFVLGESEEPKSVSLEEVSEIKEILPEEAPKPPNRLDRRIDQDSMSDPPISSQIVADIAGYVGEVESRLNGKTLNCIVLGRYTGPIAVAVSDAFGGAGGRVLCIGDCLDSDNQPLPEWLTAVGNRFKSTVFPVAGDIEETFQDSEKEIDLVLFSTCGQYANMATLISRWSGLVQSGGLVGGTQLDDSDYRASFDAIMDIFGEDRIEKSENSTCWNVKIDSGK